MSDAYTITDLTAHIRDLIDSDEALRDVWVVGEVSNMKRAASGHWYFTLKDQGAQLRCVMFKNAALRQIVEPNDGEAVRARGAVRVYEQRGEYQLYAEELQPVGTVGDLYQQFEELKARLLAEGLFDPDRKRPLPAMPRQIGIVTSPDAAAFRDVQNVLARRFPMAELILSPTKVQGADAPPLIELAIERLNAFADVDVLLIVRGGGSIEDLWAFNDERVARALANSKVPTVSGVGHETDTTIVDFVADVRAPTPSAAAEIATPSAYDLREGLLAADAALLRMIGQRVDEARSRYNIVERSLWHLSPARYVQTARQSVDDMTERLRNQQQRHLALLHERVMARTAALNAANPDSIMARGYAVVTRSEDGKVVTQAKDAKPGTGITIRLREGELKARVEDEGTHGQYKRTLF